MDEFLREFVIESNENLAAIDAALVQLEGDPSDDVVAAVFRAMHTIKGTSGFFDLPRVEKLAHTAENLLVRIRDKELSPTPPRISALLSAADALRAHVRALESDGTEAELDTTSLEALLADLTAESDDVPEPNASNEPIASTASTASAAPTATAPAGSGGAGESSIRVDVGVLDELMALVDRLEHELASSSATADKLLAAVVADLTAAV